MDLRLWKLRAEDQYLEPAEMYRETQSEFSIKFHHGGKFVENPNRKYVGGKMNYIDHVDFRVLNTDVLEATVKKLGHNNGLVFCIHYKEPYCSLDFGLRTLKCDVDLEHIFDHVRQGVHMIDIYVEHWRSTILENTSEGPIGANKAIVPASFTKYTQNDSMNEDEEESDISDPDYEYVEEDNLVSEIEVDMQRFRANVDFTREELDGSSDGDHDDDRSEEGHQPVDLKVFESGSDDNSSLRDKVARKIRRRNKWR
ncbi:hypothetical protein HanRHA438_Chr11g0531481 [Helianthus annuus]|nr:hypothetical protein HanIR_Chr11g0559861 [Helianthus annuus]KAJ0873133.1 hypothetical protein HanRHA438_Chr11g0531481 [Helianthus annuus]